MNTRFFLNFLTAPKRNAGFAMPMVIMAGLVITVAAAAIAMKGMNDQNQVTSKAMKQQSEAIAEAGATRYLDVLNRNPALLVENASEWDGLISGDEEADEDEDDVIPPQSGAQCVTANYNSAGQSINSGSGGGASLADVDVPTTPDGEMDVSEGRVRLVGYMYDPAVHVASLSVQGIVGEGANESTTQIQYAFRVRPELPGNDENVPIIPQLSGGVAGLWARNFNTSSIAYANVLDSSACATGTTSFGASIGNIPVFPIASFPNGNHTPPLSGTSAILTSQDIPFPPLPSYPSEEAFEDLVDENEVNELADCSRTQYPASGDYDSEGRPHTDNVAGPRTYRYWIPGNCTPSSSAQFGTTGRADESLIMYVDGSFGSSNGGNGQIASTGTGSAKVIWLLKTSGLSTQGNQQIGSSNALTAENWGFFLYSSATVNMGGTPDTYAFVFAPNSSFNSNGNGKIGGGVWANSISTVGNSPKFFQSITQAGINSLFTAAYNASGDITYARTPGQPQPAKIELVSNYISQEVGTQASIPAGLDYSSYFAPLLAGNNSSSVEDGGSSDSNDLVTTPDQENILDSNDGDTLTVTPDPEPAPELTKVCLSFAGKSGNCQEWGYQ